MVNKLFFLFVLIITFSFKVHAGDLNSALKLLEDRKVNEALIELNLLSDAGDVEAQFVLGTLYDVSEAIVPRDLTKAVSFYHKAAEQGHTKSQFYLGQMYRNGDGVEKDPDAAFKWYTLAALAGYSDAQYDLGMSYSYAVGTERNMAQAFDWFYEAAIQNNAAAQNNLGWMFYEGQHVTKNLVSALAWSELSMSNGYGPENNGLYRRSMTDQEILKGKGLAERCYLLMQIRGCMPHRNDE
jgi:TPR repeat protein